MSFTETRSSTKPRFHRLLVRYLGAKESYEQISVKQRKHFLNRERGEVPSFEVDMANAKKGCTGLEETEGDLLLSTAIRASIAKVEMLQRDISSLTTISGEYVGGEKKAEMALEKVRKSIEVLKMVEGDSKINYAIASTEEDVEAANVAVAAMPSLKKAVQDAVDNVLLSLPKAHATIVLVREALDGMYRG